MNDMDFKMGVHTELIRLTDLVLLHHNPCHIENGTCLKFSPGPIQCCVRTKYRKPDYPQDKTCIFLGENGCTLPNIYCKVALCKDAINHADPDCLKALDGIRELAKLYGLIDDSKY